MASKNGFTVTITEVDIRSGKKNDLTRPAVQARWLQLLSKGFFDALVVIPPCSTFSRACWANEEGPFPLRSSAYPRGFPWLKKGRRLKADFGNILGDFAFEAMKRFLENAKGPAYMERPEDLGTPVRPRAGLQGMRPASMWQFWQFQKLIEKENVRTVALAQLDFGFKSVKPTRLLMRAPGPLHEEMYEGEPRLNNFCGRFSSIATGDLCGQRFGEPSLASMARQLMLALDFMHAMGMIHRDIKPQNIMLHQISDTLQLKVADHTGRDKVHDASGSFCSMPKRWRF